MSDAAGWFPDADHERQSAEESFCAACYAEAGEPCGWDCIGYASHVDGLLGRWMTVQTSKLYAELDALSQ